MPRKVKKEVEKPLIIPPIPKPKRNFRRIFLYLFLVIFIIIVTSGIYIDTETKIAPGSVLYSTKTSIETLEYMVSQINDTWPLFLRSSLIEKRLLEMLTLSEALGNDNADSFFLFRYGDQQNINNSLKILILKTKTQIDLLDNEVRHLPLNTGDANDEDYNQIRQIVNELSETRKNILNKVLENSGSYLDETIANYIKGEVEIRIIPNSNANNETPTLLPKASGPLVPDQ